MALSTGQKSMIGEIAAWSAVTALAVAAFVYYDSIKSFSSDRLGLNLQVASRSPAAATPQSTAPSPPGRAVELRAGAGGHFHTRAEVDGRPIDVMVDTGASVVALTWEDARRVGLYLKDSDFTHTANTANGVARLAPVTLGRISIGGITLRNIPAAVGEPGKLPVTLLGMTFLNRLSRVEMRNGSLLLKE